MFHYFHSYLDCFPEHLGDLSEEPEYSDHREEILGQLECKYDGRLLLEHSEEKITSEKISFKLGLMHAKTSIML